MLPLFISLLLLFCAASAQTAEEYLKAGFAQYSQGDFKAARQFLEKAVRLQPKSVESRFLLGATLIELNDTVGAIHQLGQAHRLNPKHLDIRKLLAVQYLHNGQAKYAIALLEPIVGALPYDEEIHLLLINSRQIAGDSSGSFALARTAAERFPRSAQIAAWLGFQLQFSGRYDEAKQYLQKAIALEPAFGVPYQIMGDVFLKEENYTESIQWFRRAAATMPDDVDTLLGLSRALGEIGEIEQAIQVLSKAAQTAPKDARVHSQLSRLYFRLGDEVSARRESELSTILRGVEPPVFRPPSGLAIRRE
jgi:Flp pilus assembly protein TadD